MNPFSPVRFWTCVDASGECWLWTGNVGKNGYGQYKNQAVHRLSYELDAGPIPSGLFVCHRCDTRHCVRPDHLFLGTHAENMADMTRKGRHWSNTKPERQARGERHGRYTMPERTARGDRSAAHTHPERIVRGERVKGAKLTSAQVLQIRGSCEPIKLLAKRFGVTFQSVWNARARKTWRHVV